MQLISSIPDIDILILRAIQQGRVLAMDNVLYYISFFATYVNITLLLSILLVSLIKKSQQIRIIFYKMVVVMIVAALMSTMLKSIINRDRPFVTYPDIVKLSQAGNSSFPSGHTLEGFAVAVAFSILVPKKRFYIPVFIWASVVAYSRMALGVHYPSDVLGGMVIGSFIGWIVPWGFDKIFHQRK